MLAGLQPPFESWAFLASTNVVVLQLLTDHQPPGSTATVATENFCLEVQAGTGIMWLSLMKCCPSGCNIAHVKGLTFVLTTAVIWVAASFVVQDIDQDLGALTLTYIANSLFSLYLPIFVACVRWQEKLAHPAAIQGYGGIVSFDTQLVAWHTPIIPRSKHVQKNVSQWHTEFCCCDLEHMSECLRKHRLLPDQCCAVTILTMPRRWKGRALSAAKLLGAHRQTGIALKTP